MDALHIVKTAATILGFWTALSVPVGVVIGTYLKGAARAGTPGLMVRSVTIWAAPRA